jgi:hypothetical protein
MLAPGHETAMKIGWPGSTVLAETYAVQAIVSQLSV